MALGVYLSLRASGVSKMSVIIVRHLGFFWVLDELIYVMHFQTNQAYSKRFTSASWVFFFAVTVAVHFFCCYCLVAKLCPTLCNLRDYSGVGYHFLLHGIFPTQGLNLGLSHHGQILYH